MPFSGFWESQSYPYLFWFADSNSFLTTSSTWENCIWEVASRWALLYFEAESDTLPNSSMCIPAHGIGKNKGRLPSHNSFYGGTWCSLKQLNWIMAESKSHMASKLMTCLCFCWGGRCCFCSSRSLKDLLATGSVMFRENPSVWVYTDRFLFYPCGILPSERFNYLLSSWKLVNILRQETQNHKSFFISWNQLSVITDVSYIFLTSLFCAFILHIMVQENHKNTIKCPLCVRCECKN